MKKQKMTLLILLIALICIVIAAVFFSNRVPSDEDTTEETTTTREIIFNNDFDTMTSLEIHNETGNYTYNMTPGDEYTSPTWSVDGINLDLDSSSLNSLGHTISYFQSNVIENGDFDEYGIDENTYVTVHYSDGLTTTMYIGDATPDNSYYYVAVNDDPNVYFITYITGNKFFSTINDFVLKTLPTISNDRITDFQVVDNEGNDFHVKYEGETAPEDEYNNYGGIMLTEVSPFDGYEIYSDILNEDVFSNIQNLEFSDLVEVNPTDLSIYGLDAPSLKIAIQTIDMNGYTLLVGNEVNVDDTDYYYTMIDDDSAVFLMKKSLVDKFRNIDGFNFIDKFINLENIDEVKSIDVNILGADYLLETNHETVKNGDEDEILIHPTINGKAIDEDEFRNIYQAVIAISYDNPVDKVSPSTLGDKVLTINYIKEDGTSTYSDYYIYDENFLGVSKDGGDVEFVTNTNDIKYLKSILDNSLESTEE